MTSGDTQSSSPSIHLPPLDGLRGAAAIAVVLGHCSLEGFLPAYLRGFGQLGVATFFVLSGFLMAHLYLRRPFSRKECRAYLVARGARVLPLFWSVACCASLLLLLIGTSLYGIMDGVGVLRNLALVRGDGVFWTIPVEIHFYLIFMFLWWATSRGYFWGMLIILLTVQTALAFSLWEVLKDGRWIWYWLHLFLAGAVIASCLRPRLYPTCRLKSNSPYHILGWLIVLMLFFSPAGARDHWGLPLLPSPVDPLIAGLAVLLVFATALHLGPLTHLKTRFFTFFGEISFSVYLLHVPALIVARELGPFIEHFPLAQFAVVCLITVSVSILSYRLLEVPLSKKLRTKFNSKPKKIRVIS